MFTLVFSEKINNDIISALNYIRNVLEAPMAAKNHFEELRDTYEKLKENPYARPLVQDNYLATKGIRFINVKNYILIYTINEENKTVYLYRFLYCRRDWVNILADELKE